MSRPATSWRRRWRLALRLEGFELQASSSRAGRASAGWAWIRAVINVSDKALAWSSWQLLAQAALCPGRSLRGSNSFVLQGFGAIDEGLSRFEAFRTQLRTHWGLRFFSLLQPGSAE